MTGAPKLRTMEILQELEEQVEQGPYSGSFGYLSLNGSMDMHIIIRSAILTREEGIGSASTTSSAASAAGGLKVSIGDGGAITALSDEYEEMLLKASAIVQAVHEWAATGATGTTPGISSPFATDQAKANYALTNTNKQVCRRKIQILV
jgi:para-aminobenzoate synthetase